MAVAPEHFRAARLAIPRLPLPAILGFAFAAVGGSIFLAFTSFNHAEAKHSVAASNDVPVYSAQAVPFDSPRDEPGERAASIARALSATQGQVFPAENIEPQEAAPVSKPALLAEANRQLRGFSGFPNFAGGNNFAALTGTSFGISAQSAPSGFVAPDAETLTTSAVPEASTWMCGGALLVLVALRGAHASWHRRQRRSSNKSHSARF
jgi:hypothetical protein